MSEIKDYTGENTKISCDRIETGNELVKEQWDYFVMDIVYSFAGFCSGSQLDTAGTQTGSCFEMWRSQRDAEDEGSFNEGAGREAF